MKKKLIFSVLGTGFVVALVRAIAKESKKLVAQDAETEFWCWLSGVWEAHAGLSSYTHDRRTFGNSVWDSGITKALDEFDHRLQHYPGQILESFGYDFREKCAELRTEAYRDAVQIRSEFLEKDRRGVNSTSDLLGEVITKLNYLGDQHRIERILGGVG